MGGERMADSLFERSSEYGKKGNKNIQGANASIALVFVSILQAIKWEGS